MPGAPGHEAVDHPSLSIYVNQMEEKNLSYMNLLAYIHFLTLNRDMRAAILSEVKEDVSKITYEMIRSKPAALQWYSTILKRYNTVRQTHTEGSTQLMHGDCKQ